MKIYLDDIRETPEGWTRCFKIEEVQDLLQKNIVANLSLDHDLGASYLCNDCYDMGSENEDCTDDCQCKCHLVDFLRVPTGYDLCKWMAEFDCWPVNKPTVHSANPVGRVNMQAVIDRYWHAPGTKARI